ncbi:PLDc N-terminal domain-containing protein [Myceligenerans xiligouense]|uniref:Phospholipase D-like protein n=1 Tax=Myceligenerans xiligouense TaxID=253184 RepID=A0A3N4ZBY5_9MICO|nr:PLDc N-terminal domain-containing protein [Myceligenerans xiligouense]RPF22982.1 phospholipase D-like protein [Myceligenerans xiligouense]
MFIRVVLPILAVGLLVYALVDVLGAPPHERAGLPRWAWVLIVLVPVLGPGAWIYVRTVVRHTGRLDR